MYKDIFNRMHTYLGELEDVLLAVNNLERAAGAPLA